MQQSALVQLEEKKKQYLFGLFITRYRSTGGILVRGKVTEYCVLFSQRLKLMGFVGLWCGGRIVDSIAEGGRFWDRALVGCFWGCALVSYLGTRYFRSFWVSFCRRIARSQMASTLISARLQFLIMTGISYHISTFPIAILCIPLVGLRWAVSLQGSWWYMPFPDHL
ncbi:hypothetical protein L873DRAFT_366618 [Choiromyces venosus 120613-1]|uniref:Uncharacterized protein n=1 Tax=Choiromyces venosus 120613-1 TaxID=1336337 RepID=A0A3N4JZW5_9PEZI|nr:hypothetical protein L873DRAFT_366618 [Choiromyces venosus 120613-1]